MGGCLEWTKSRGNFFQNSEISKRTQIFFTVIVCAASVFCIQLLITGFIHFFTVKEKTSEPSPFKEIMSNWENRTIGWEGGLLVESLTCVRSRLNKSVVVVSSSSYNSGRRRLIRNTWGSHLSLYFIIEEPTSPEILQLVSIEKQVYNDILQVQQNDSDRAWKYGLAWAVSCFSDGSDGFIIKTDDDVFVNAPFLKLLLDHLPHEYPKMDRIVCSTPEDSEIVDMDQTHLQPDTPGSNGRTAEEFCADWGIIFTVKAAYDITSTAKSVGYVGKDNVFLTGLGRQKTDIEIVFYNILFPPLTFVEWALKRNATSYLFSRIPPERFPDVWKKTIDLDQGSNFTMRWNELQNDVSLFMKENPTSIFKWNPFMFT